MDSSVLSKLHQQEREVSLLTQEIETLQREFLDNPTDLKLASGDGNSEDLKASVALVQAEVEKLKKEKAKLKYRLKILEESIIHHEKCDDDDGNNMPPLQAVLTCIFTQAVQTAFPELVLNPSAVTVAPASKPQFGDFQFNSAMTISQALRSASGTSKPLNPRQVAERVVAAVSKSDEIEKLEIAGPGFVNITLSPQFIGREVNKIAILGARPPVQMGSKKRRVLVDFSSPNVAKEMHVGHLRSTIIGDCICRLLEFAGLDVLRINHLGDWGTQFGMLIAHLKEKFPDYLVSPPPVKDLQVFYKESKGRFDSDAEFKKRAYAAVVALQGGEPDHVHAWKLIVEASEKEFSDIYRRLRVTITNRGESFYQSRMEGVVEELKQKGLLLQDEGRWVMFAPDLKIPLTMVKSDGGFTYDTSDMAAIKQRIEEEKVDWIIYVTDMGQAGHFDVIFGCAERAGWLDKGRVRVSHAPHGVVLGEDKKKLKTRSGDTIRLVDLLNEGIERAAAKLKEKERESVLTEEELVEARDHVAYSCIKYNDLCHDRTNDYIFSFDRMLEDKGNTAAYLLYMLTRIRSISRNANVSVEEIQREAEKKDLTLEHPKELKLAKTLLRFPDTILRVLDELTPHHLCSYIYEVATVFSEFYDSCYCVERNPQNPQEVIRINMHRMVLCQATAEIMSKTFDILGLMPVSKM